MQNQPQIRRKNPEMDTQVLAKLQAIIAEENNKEAVVPMENISCNTGIEGEKMDTPRDTLAPDFDGFIRTYKELGKREKRNFKVIPGNEKTPVPQGQTGDYEDGGRYWIRTSDPYNVSTETKNCNPFNSKTCANQKKPLSCKLTVSHDKPSGAEVPPMPTDLAEVAALWPDLAVHVRTGILAMVKAAAGKG
jgi:hypothetical protein